MTASVDAAVRDSGGGLDNLTLARKEGWRRLVQAPPRVQPEHLSARRLRALDPAALATYDRQRREWHANLGPLRTPQLAELHEDLWDIVDSNAQIVDKAKGAIAVDAFPGVGWGRPPRCWHSRSSFTGGRSPNRAS